MDQSSDPQSCADLEALVSTCGPAELQALHVAYKRATGVKQLRRMLSEASKSESAQFAVLARQIGIRKHVNQVQKPVGKGYSSMKAQQLQPLVEAMVQQEKYTKPQLVKVPALKPRGRADALR
mgnify:CR=1 FL=1